EKDPASGDWTLTGALPPNKTFNLTDIVGKLLSRCVTLPSDAPQIVFNTVTATAGPGKTFSLTAGSPTRWKLLGDLWIDHFTLSVGYTSGRPKVSLDTALTIANVPIRISATLDTSGTKGWTFKGTTAQGVPIDIDDLIADLKNKFSVPVEPSIKRLKLQNLELEFVGGTSADSAPQHFGFGCQGLFSIAGVDLDAKVAIDLTPAAGGA